MIAGCGTPSHAVWALLVLRLDLYGFAALFAVVLRSAIQVHESVMKQLLRVNLKQTEMGTAYLLCDPLVDLAG